MEEQRVSPEVVELNLEQTCLRSSHTENGHHLLRRLDEAGLVRTFVNRFFSTCTLPCSESRADDGYLDFLPHLYHQSPQDSCLRATVHALAYASIPEFKDCPWMQDTVTNYCNRALTAVQEALADDIESGKDSTLVSVLLLSMLENFHCLTINCIAWHTHIDQAVEILCKRGEQQFLSLIGLKLFRTTYAHMLVSSLCTKQTPVIPICVWLDHFNASITSQLMLLVHRTAAVCARWHEVTSPSIAPVCSESIEVLKEAKELAIDLQKWNDQIPAEMQYQARKKDEDFHLPDMNDHNPNAFYSSQKLSSIKSVVYLNIFRACRILLHQIIFQYCDRVLSKDKFSNTEDYFSPKHEMKRSPTTDTSRLSEIEELKRLFMDSMEIIKKTTQDICATLPRLLSTSNGMDYSTDPPTLAIRQGGVLKSQPETVTGDGSSLQKYALLFPLWAAQSSYEMIMEAEHTGTLPISIPATAGDETWRTYESLENAINFVHKDLGMTNRIVRAKPGLGDRSLSAPDIFGFEGVTSWLDGVTAN